MFGVGSGSSNVDYRGMRMCCDLCRDGASRQFGYVGFETAEDAGAAKNFLDRTFMGASRLSIEVNFGSQVAFQFC